MPQASDELRAMFHDDGEAWRKIELHFDDTAGVIYPKIRGYKPTEEEGNAIDYLCDEWDYGYDPEGK